MSCHSSTTVSVHFLSDGGKKPHLFYHSQCRLRIHCCLITSSELFSLSFPLFLTYSVWSKLQQHNTSLYTHKQFLIFLSIRLSCALPFSHFAQPSNSIVFIGSGALLQRFHPTLSGRRGCVSDAFSCFWFNNKNPSIPTLFSHYLIN